MNSPLTDFCNARLIPDNIKAAFAAYLRAEYSRKFLLDKEGETVHLMIGKMTEKQLAEGWSNFVLELQVYLRDSNNS